MVLILHYTFTMFITLLYNVQCIMYTVYCIVYTVHCTLCSVQCAVYSVQCTSVYYTLYTVHYNHCINTYSVRRKLYVVQSVRRTLCTICTCNLFSTTRTVITSWLKVIYRATVNCIYIYCIMLSYVLYCDVL